MSEVNDLIKKISDHVEAYSRADMTPQSFRVDYKEWNLLKAHMEYNFYNPPVKSFNVMGHFMGVPIEVLR